MFVSNFGFCIHLFRTRSHGATELKGRFIKHRTHDVNKKKKDNDDKVEDKHVYVDNDNKGKDEHNDKEKYKFKTEKTTRQAKDVLKFF